MSKRSGTKQRFLFWILFVVTLILIAFGYWKINGSIWEEFREVQENGQTVTNDLLQEFLDTTEEIEEEMSTIEEAATEIVIEALADELNNQENYGQEESDQEAGEAGEESGFEEEGSGQEETGEEEE